MHLLLRHRLIDFADRNQLFDFHNLPCCLWTDGMEDRLHSLVETKRTKDTRSRFGESDGAAYLCDSEVWHGKERFVESGDRGLAEVSQDYRCGWLL